MVVCFFIMLAVVKTSWTPLNPRRRLYAFPMNDSICRFIGWLDSFVCAMAKPIIWGMLKYINTLEEECNGLLRSINMVEE